MLATSALVIKRWEFRKPHVLRREITLRVHSEFSQSVCAILVNSDNFAIADVSYCVGRFYQFERLPRLIVESARGRIRRGELEIPRNI